jgi:hypothetical protein
MGVGCDRMAERDAATPSEPRDFALVQAAFGLYERGDFEWAVVALQTASEVALEQHVARMLEWRELGSLGGAIERRSDPSRGCWARSTTARTPWFGSASSSDICVRSVPRGGHANVFLTTIVKTKANSALPNA